MRQDELTERLLRLRGVPAFRSLSAVDLAPVARSMRSATFHKGQIVMREDEGPKAFHMLLTGAVSMWRRGHKIRTITAPGGVGFLSLLARTGGGTEAIAEAQTESLEVRSDAVHELFEDHFSVLLRTLVWVIDQLRVENLVQEPRPYTPPADGFDQVLGENELGIVERIFLLRGTPTFKNANVNSIARLARAMNEVRFAAGETIWRPGERSTGPLFIVKGKMKLVWAHPDHGRPMEQIVGPGYVVGGGEAIADRPRWNELVTLDAAVVLQGTREAMIDMLEDDLDAALQFLSTLSGLLLARWDSKAEAEALASAQP